MWQHSAEKILKLEYVFSMGFGHERSKKFSIHITLKAKPFKLRSDCESVWLNASYWNERLISHVSGTLPIQGFTYLTCQPLILLISITRCLAAWIIQKERLFVLFNILLVLDQAMNEMFMLSNK